MASGGHMLQQQKASVEARIKSLVNNDLKEICRAYNYQVSGSKAQLQKRCSEILTNIVNNGDQAGFRDLNYRVSNHGLAPPRPLTSSMSTCQQSNGNYPYTAVSAGSAASASRIAHNRAMSNGFFRKSPFYDDHEQVLPLTDLPEMPQNRHTVRVTLTLDQVNAAQLKSDPTLRLLLYCGVVNHFSEVDVSFPNQLEIKINGDDVRGNFKGLKNKPGSTKPADITDKVRRTAGYSNQLSITYALTQKRYSFTVQLVRHVPYDVLTRKIKDCKHGGGIITKQQVMAELTKANADPEIAATSVRMSLKDPVSTLRITLPVRSTVCAHNQCFDGSMFMQLQEQAPQWSCPVCSKTVSFESLCVDKYFEEILENTPSSIEKVDIEPDGRWHIIKEEEEAQPSTHSSRENRASYDDDYDDDEDLQMVNPPDMRSRSVNETGLGSSATPSAPSPMIGSSFAMNTPPLSSRGPSAAPSTTSTQLSTKRAASAVIDLTLSDDDEQPPRLAKRQSTNTTSTHLGLPAPSPLSHAQITLPEPLPAPYGLSNVTDPYRASVSAARPSSSSQGRGSVGPQYTSTSFANEAGSPFRVGDSSSPSFSINSTNTGTHTNNWASHTSRTPSTLASANSGLTFPPLTIRPPASTPTGSKSQIRLPPINPHPPDGLGGQWRADHSPPG